MKNIKPWSASSICIQQIPNLADNRSEALSNLQDFKAFLEQVDTPHEHGYSGLTAWESKVGDKLRLYLKETGFNELSEDKDNNHPYSLFHQGLLCMYLTILDSPNFISEVAPHHASVYERNNALLVEVSNLISSFTEAKEHEKSI